MDPLVQAQDEIFEALFGCGTLCATLRSSPSPLVERWQQFLDRALHTQCEVIRRYGYSGDQQGIQQFNAQIAKAAVQDEAVQERLSRFWTHLFEKAFGMSQPRKIAFQQARQIIQELADQVRRPALLQQAEQIGRGSQDPVEVRPS